MPSHPMNRIRTHFHPLLEFLAPGCWRAMLLSLMVTMSTAMAGEDRAFEIATAAHRPGRFVAGQCWPFAEDLFTQLCRSGIEAHLVVYQWHDTFGRQGAHAVVVYRDQDRHFWAMDNLRHQPFWVSGNSPQTWCVSFAPNQSITVTLHRTSLEEKSRPALSLPPVQWVAFTAKKLKTPAAEPELQAPPPAAEGGGLLNLLSSLPGITPEAADRPGANGLFY